MKRSNPHVEASLAVRLGCAVGAAAFSAVILGTLVGAMAPLGHDVEAATATDVAIVPSRIEVVGSRATTTVRSVAAPHVG
jgi:hypothetical protein